jgi:hypothetical protein
MPWLTVQTWQLKNILHPMHMDSLHAPMLSKALLHKELRICILPLAKCSAAF